MIFYIVFFVFVLLSLLSIDRHSKESYLYLVTLLFFTFLVGSRYASTDYFQYQYIYENITDISKLGLFIYPVSLTTPIESGFALFALFIKAVGGDFFLFIFAFSSISIYLKFRAFRKLSPFFLVSILVYISDEYFFKDMGQIRNSMASGILLYSFYCIYHGWFFRHIAVVFLAGMFHSFAFIALFLYFVRYFKSRTVMTLIAIVSFIIAALGGVGMMIPEVASGFGLENTSRIIKYTNSEYAEGKSVLSGTVLFHVFWCFFYIKYYHLLKNKWSYNDILIPIYVYGTCIMLVLIDFGIVSARVREMICLPANAVLLPSFLLLFKGQDKILGYLAISGYCLLYFLALMSDFSYNYQLFFLR
ncbi:EpsG family protein [Pseudoalteromonas sp. TAB23]|uniref:EpsG family protein n=1 Tax=Pseudoalteromonas sp. TAB23 TaxID=1938595 RepID=UPI00040AE1DC|nr:EpsG family protein [Pseudoalteromonas sp. TAB23]